MTALLIIPSSECSQEHPWHGSDATADAYTSHDRSGYGLKLEAKGRIGLRGFKSGRPEHAGQSSSNSTEHIDQEDDPLVAYPRVLGGIRVTANGINVAPGAGIVQEIINQDSDDDCNK